MLGVIDSANNYVFEVHEYFDSDYSGTSSDCPDANAGTDTFTDFISTFIFFI